MSFASGIGKEQKEEGALIAEWEMGEYHNNPCPQCGRSRLCLCSNGKHRCEKCNWVPEDGQYCPAEL